MKPNGTPEGSSPDSSKAAGEPAPKPVQSFVASQAATQLTTPNGSGTLPRRKNGVFMPPPRAPIYGAGHMQPFSTPVVMQPFPAGPSVLQEQQQPRGRDVANASQAAQAHLPRQQLQAPLMPVQYVPFPPGYMMPAPHPYMAPLIPQQLLPMYHPTAIPQPHPAAPAGSPKPAANTTSTSGPSGKDDDGGQRRPSRPHQCPSCDRRFRQKGDWRRHIKTVHEGVKEFQCMHCNLQFGRKRNMLRHVETVHEKRRDYSCLIPNCGKAFGQKADLQKHMCNVHRMDTAAVKSMIASMQEKLRAQNAKKETDISTEAKNEGIAVKDSSKPKETPSDSLPASDENAHAKRRKIETDSSSEKSE